MNVVECKSVNCLLPEAVASDVDTLFSNLPQECRQDGLQRKAYVSEAIQFEPNERSEVSILSTETVDKTREIVLIGGLQLDHYRKGLQVLWNHDYNAPPVAKCQWIKACGDTLRAKSLYPERITPPQEGDRPFYIDYIWDLVATGLLSAKSIGFIGTKPRRDPTSAELAAHPDWRGAKVWPETMLFEYSLVPVGVNNDSLVELINRKSLTVEACEALGLEVTIPEPATAAPPEPPALTVAEVIAFLREANRRPIKKGLDPTKIIDKLLDMVKVDSCKIADDAIRLHKNRGKASR